MKFLANENFPLKNTLYLQAQGIDIKAIVLYAPSISDREVMEIAIQENRTILTFDRDYGELIFRYGYKPPAGVIYLRFKQFTPEFPGQYLMELLLGGDFQWENRFTVLDEGFIRQRKFG
jgi:predicted nuclease of predicted toxin-antitoxin system